MAGKERLEAWPEKPRKRLEDAAFGADGFDVGHRFDGMDFIDINVVYLILWLKEGSVS